MESEPLIDRFKSYYFDYRKTTDVDDSFEQARSAIAYHVINEADQLALNKDFEGIRDMCRQFREIESSTYGSNDSVKERFEREFVRYRMH